MNAEIVKRIIDEITYDAINSKDVETGGLLYGHYEKDKIIILKNVKVPAKIQSKYEFEIDENSAIQINEKIEREGYKYLGNWHKHLGYGGPSHGDDEQAKNFLFGNPSQNKYFSLIIDLFQNGQYNFIGTIYEKSLRNEIHKKNIEIITIYDKYKNNGNDSSNYLQELGKLSKTIQNITKLEAKFFKDFNILQHVIQIPLNKFYNNKRNLLFYISFPIQESNPNDYVYLGIISEDYSIYRTLEKFTLNLVRSNPDEFIKKIKTILDTIDIYLDDTYRDTIFKSHEKLFNALDKITVVISNQIKVEINEILKTKNTDAVLPVYGKVFDDHVLHLFSTFENNDKSITKIGEIEIDTKEKDIIIIVSKEIKITLKADELNTFRKIDKKISYLNKVIDIKILIVDLMRLFARIDNNSLPIGILNKKKVVIIGLGSGGSLIASHLAKAGVKEFIFIDNDSFEVHNIIRHICSLEDIGRYKTHAVKDYIVERIPDVEIKTINDKFSINYVSDEERFKNLLGDVDLIVSATGNHASYMNINSFAYRNKIPVIYGGVFDKIKGGIMIRVDPNKNDICYSCIYDNNEEKLDDIQHLMPTAEENNPYGLDEDDLYSQPGLGMDVDFMSLLLTKFILSTLLDNTKHDLYRFSNNIYTWYNKDQDMNKAYQLYIINDLMNRNNECKMCK